MGTSPVNPLDPALPVSGVTAKDTALRPLRPTLSAVVPSYNEADNLPALLPRLIGALQNLTDHWEVVVVDDGSRDHTPLAMAPFLTQPGVCWLRLSRNFGKEAALSAGLERARGQVVVLMDADLQHAPELIGAMLQRWQEGADTVCAVREHRADEGWVKRLGTKMFYGIVNAGASVRIPEGAGDFRLMDRRVVDALVALPERNRFLKGLYAWVGFHTVYLPYVPDARASGHTTFSLQSLRRLAVTGITSFSTLPLRFWSGIGGLIALCSLAYGAWIAVEYFVSGNPVAGWPTLAAGMMFFSGVQLLSIGILGEYVGRIFEEVKGRPIYLVDREVGQSLIGPPR
jgi:polyisoprenyl-phosphate glycosyltransferase